MRFFTPEWHGGDITEAESDAVLAAYQRHVAEILPQLHATVRVLARELALHDARVRRVVVDRPGGEVRVELRCGDRQAGYYDLDLVYLDAVVDARDATELAAAARDPRSELLYDEVDVIDGAGEAAYLHRMLFWPYRDVEIMFRALSLRLAPRADRSVPLFADRYVEAG